MAGYAFTIGLLSTMNLVNKAIGEVEEAMREPEGYRSRRRGELQQRGGEEAEAERMRLLRHSEQQDERPRLAA